MTLVQLDYALAVLKSGSIVGAAEACRVTQPTLTQQLRKLEAELGGALFNRGRHPLRPTSLGRRVLAQAVRVRAEAGRLEALVEGRGEGLEGSLRLGVIPSVAGSLLPRVAPAFLKRHPGIALRVAEHQTRDLVRLLLDGELDAGIAAVPLEVRGLALSELYREGFMAYLPPEHPLLSRRELAPSALAAQALLLMSEGHCFRHQVLSLCKAPPATDGVYLESGSFQTLAALVDQGLGCTVLPRLGAEDLSAEQRLRLRPLAGPPAVRVIALLQARPAPRQRAVAALATFIRECFKGAEGARGRVLKPGQPPKGEAG